MSELHVLIVGGGITGLVIAHGLQQAGIKFTVFEREPSAAAWRPGEWGLSVHWGLPLLKRCLPPDLAERLYEAQTDPTYKSPDSECLPLYNMQTGEHIKDTPLPSLTRFSRHRLRAFCTQRIDIESLVDVKYGDDGGVTAVFEDGTEYTGTTLVATDGARSKTRQLLLGDEGISKPLELITNQSSVNYHDAAFAKQIRDIHPMFFLGIHPNGTNMFMSFSQGTVIEDPSTWSYTILSSWPGQRIKGQGTDQTRLAELKERFSSFAEPFRSAVLRLPDDTPVPDATLGYWATLPWNNHNGRICLAGDAAHSLPPQRGQGLNMCLGDAAAYVDAIVRVHKGEATLSEAVTGVADKIVEQGSAEVPLSVKSAMFMHNWDTLFESPRFKIGVKAS